MKHASQTEVKKRHTNTTGTPIKSVCKCKADSNGNKNMIAIALYVYEYAITSTLKNNWMGFFFTSRFCCVQLNHFDGSQIQLQLIDAIFGFCLCFSHRLQHCFIPARHTPISSTPNIWMKMFFVCFVLSKLNFFFSVGEIEMLRCA